MQYKPFQDQRDLLAFFSSKTEGNLAFHVDDTLLDVEKRHVQLATKYAYQKDKLVFMKQVHSKNVYHVSTSDNFSTVPEADALITNEKNIPLMVMMADCCGILFYDPTHKAIGVAHAGRAGAFLNIVQNLITQMQKKFTTQAQDLYVALSADIHACCYEVGEEIVKEAEALELSFAITQKEGRYYLDINAILLRQLQKAGVQTQNIEICPFCTSCSRDTYFSYRAERKTGRFAGVLMLR